MTEKFRYDTSKNWYRGNTHIHTTASDGGKSPSELASIYADAGYDFLFRTDHEVASKTTCADDESPLLWIDGIEISGDSSDGEDYHVVCLGSFSNLPGSDKDLGERLKIIRRQGGITILAHPHWSAKSISEALRFGFDGIEVYNHVCHWLNGKSSGLYHWDAMLEHYDVLGFAADDAHLRGGNTVWNGGWIVVNAPHCTSEAITEAIRAGSFYSSQGPEFYYICLKQNRVCIKTSPVQFIRLCGPGAKGTRTGTFDGQLLVDAEFEVPESWQYARIEIEAENGLRAWTNTLFI